MVQPSAENSGGSAVAVRFTVHRQGVDVPVILQRQVRAVPGDSRRLPQFQSSTILRRVLGAFLRHLSDSVHLDVESRLAGR